MARHWRCPDLGLHTDPGREHVIPGSRFVFDQCPRYWLRTVGDGLPADHLVSGIHPANIVFPVAAEFRVGASAGDDHAPKVAALARIMVQEQDERVAYELKQDRLNRERTR